MCTPQPAAGRIRLTGVRDDGRYNHRRRRGNHARRHVGTLLEHQRRQGRARILHRPRPGLLRLAPRHAPQRTGELHVPAGVPDRVLFREANYYGLLDRARAARIGELDLDRARLAASVPPGRAPVACPAVRAAPDGGCCVTHGPIVRVYDWMLEERRPVCLTSAQAVRDAAYLSDTTLLVGGRGMALSPHSPAI
ncbi:hypothetical protein ZWY2020_044970 [Hordeum vulgare]|nr:hypothetical protein ZWY2020_044970 [Hordeum vulgare]